LLYGIQNTSQKNLFQFFAIYSSTTNTDIVLDSGKMKN